MSGHACLHIALGSWSLAARLAVQLAPAPHHPGMAMLFQMQRADKIAMRPQRNARPIRRERVGESGGFNPNIATYVRFDGRKRLIGAVGGDLPTARVVVGVVRLLAAAGVILRPGDRVVRLALGADAAGFSADALPSGDFVGAEANT